MNVDAQVQVTANADLSEAVLGIGTSLLGVVGNPWFILSVAVAFNIGQFAHVVLKGYFDEVTRDLDKAIVIWLVQLASGYFATYYLVDHHLVHKYAVLTGMCSIILYYLLRWLANWRRWPMLMTWLTLRKCYLDENGKVKKGRTIGLLNR